MINILEKKVFIFDLDGTIVNSLNMYEEVDKSIIKKLTSIEVKDMYNLMKKCQVNVKDSNNYIEYVKFLNKELNVNIDENQFIQLRKESIVKYLENVELKDNVDIFISLLKLMNKKIFIATNNSLIDIYKNNNVNTKYLLKKVDEIFTCPDNLKKPNSYIYESIISKYNFNKDDCISFEDSRDGVIAAHNASIDVINIYENKSQKYIDDIKLYTPYINYEYEKLIDNNIFLKYFGYLLKNININNTYSFIKYSLSLNNKYINDKIGINIGYILKKVSRNDLPQLLLLLKDNFMDKLKENFDFIKDKALPNTSGMIFDIFISDTDFISNNISDFLGIAFNDEIEQKMLYIYNSIEETKKKLNELNNVLNSYPMFFRSINKGVLLKINDNCLLDYIYSLFVKYSTSLNDVQLYSKGLTSIVFKCNDYVIKIGRNRIKFDIKYSKYILQPYIREKIGDIVIEIQDACSNDVNIDDLKTIDNSLKETGLIWLDKKIDNIGKLIKDNYVHSNKTSIYNANNNEVLEKGNIVVYDTDWLYTKDELRIHYEDMDTISSLVNIQIFVDDNLEAITKIFNQVYENYSIIVTDSNLEKIDSRITKKIEENISIIDYRDIDLNDNYFLGRLYEKSINDRTK